MNTITLPSNLKGFINTNTKECTTVTDKTIYLLDGELETHDQTCPMCGEKMHMHDTYDVALNHLPMGSTLSVVRFPKHRYYCPKCKATQMERIQFQAAGHRMTEPLLNFAEDLLRLGHTLKDVAYLTGLGKNVVKAIDRRRLESLYCKPNSTEWKVPDEAPNVIGIDEFKLHNGYKYATIILSMETGHVLYLAKGKKKQVVYDFIDFVGEEWMDNVEAVCCDMNSDYQEAFEERCTHMQIVFDYFHTKKNLNGKVISEVRKDEQARLKAEGKEEEAKKLKKTKFILTSSRSTLKKNDSKNGTATLAKYESLLKENVLLCTADIVKEKLSYAYTLSCESKMANEITDIIDICNSTENKHFLWFARLLENHFEGIIAHATYRISSGKVEGMNNKIKTIRRQGYGYPDDDYFFLKIFDASRETYIRNPKSHKIQD